MSDFDDLLKLFAECVYILFYPATIIWVVLTLNLGIWNWFVVALALMPLAILWYAIVKKRTENYWKLILEKPRILNLEKALSEYIELLKKRRNAKP